MLSIETKTGEEKKGAWFILTNEKGDGHFPRLKLPCFAPKTSVFAALEGFASDRHLAHLSAPVNLSHYQKVVDVGAVRA